MKKKGHKKLGIALGILAALAAAVVVLPRVAGDRQTTGSAALKTDTVKVGDIQVTAEGSGTIEASSTKAVALEYDGKLEKIYVEKGDQVKVGDELARYDTDALDNVIDAKEQELSTLNDRIAALDKSGSDYISAPVSGRVKRIFAAVGDVAEKVVETNGGVAEISADGKLRVEFDSDVAYLVEGDSVTVEFDAESVTGTVEQAEDGHFTVTIKDSTEYEVDTVATVRGRSGEVIGEGELKSNHPYLVNATYGIIDSVKVTKKSQVSSGDTLFVRKDVSYNREYLDLLDDREEMVDEIRELKEYQKNPVVVSEADGYIDSLDVIEGMTYEKDQQLCTIADEAKLTLKVDIDELDIDGIYVDQSAEVVFDAFEDRTYSGTVTKISGVGSNNGGVTTYTVTIELEGDSHLKNAMSATATLVTNSAEGVLMVPIDAVESIDGERFVNVVKDGQTEQRAVTIGLTTSELAEVKEGLTEGESVVVKAKETEDLFTAMMRQRQESMGMNS